MNSILTNTSAMTALQVLNQTNKNLAVTQGRISTGLKVATADQNAAIYAMAGTMRADVAGYQTIQEGLSLAESAVSVARAASESIGELLKEVKTKITSAQDGTQDRTKIQAEIDELKGQINGIIESASFNGINYLKGKDGVDVLSALNRSTTDGANYTVTTGNISFNKQNLATNAATDILPTDVSVTDAGKVADGTTGTAATASVTVYTFAQFKGAAAGTDDAIAADQRFTKVTLTMADGTRIALNAPALNNAADMGAFATALATELNNSANVPYADEDGDGAAEAAGSFAVNWDITKGELTVTDNAGRGVALTFEGERTGKLAALASLDVTSDAGAKAALADVETLIQDTLNAASALGASQKRLSVQRDFLSKLVDSVNTGIGTLVDADMTQESARLQSLQVQQQLATQSLAIANQAPQTILGLFR